MTAPGRPHRRPPCSAAPAFSGAVSSVGCGRPGLRFGSPRAIPSAVDRCLPMASPASHRSVPTSTKRARSPPRSPVPYAVVNAVSLYVERGKDTFRSVHVEAAARVARSAAEAGVSRLVHVSGIGADAGSPSAYIRSRGEGEEAVLRAFAAATLIRPAIMFGPDDAFVARLLSMLRRLPAFPLFGNGGTRLQPVYVDSANSGKSLV